jgi:hypothetical protein
MDQLLAGGSHEECSDDISVGNVEQFGALLGEASNVLTKSFI